METLVSPDMDLCTRGWERRAGAPIITFVRWRALSRSAAECPDANIIFVGVKV